MMFRRHKLMISLLMCLIVLFGVTSPSVWGASPQIYNQDGFGFSGLLPGGSEPLGEDIMMIGHNAWPDGFTKNTTATFGGGVFDGEYIWMIPDRADRVIRIDTSDGTMTGFNDWPDGFNNNAVNKFVGGVYDGEAVWMIPSTGNMVVKIDSDGAMTGYNSWPDGINPEHVGKFKGGAFDGEFIWMVPSNNFEKLVKISTSTGVMTVYENWPDGFDGGGLNKFGGAVFDGVYVWLIPANADRVIKIHKDTGAMTGYDGWPSGLTRHGYGNFQGGFYDGEYVYMQPSEASVMVKVEANGTMSTVTGSDKGFNGGAFDGKHIWMAPTSASSLKAYNIETGTFHSYSAWPSGFSKGTFGFVGGVFDGESVWLIPNTANMVLQIKTLIPEPDVTISTSSIGYFQSGATGVSYSAKVTNTGTLATNGAVSVTLALPEELTATAISGNGWECDIAAFTCARHDALAAGSSYPDITVTFDVDEFAYGYVPLTATVSGGGENNANNNENEELVSIWRTYKIGLSQTGPLEFPAARFKYAPVEPEQITIYRTGTGDVNNLQVEVTGSPVSFTVSSPLETSITESVYSTTFTVNPNHALPAGTYTNTIVVSGSGGALASFGVSFTVNRAKTQTDEIIIPTPPKETVKVRVEDAGARAGATVMEVDIQRTTLEDGSKKDEVVFTAEQAKRTAESMASAGSHAASIVIPDEQDEVSELHVTVPQASQQLIRDAAIDFGISTDHVQVVIPHGSWQGFADDLHFKFTPIKAAGAKQDIQERAGEAAVVRTTIGDNELTVIGRPMTIETNMQNHLVTLLMPLPDGLDEQDFDSLGVYIEHSDGTTQFLRGVVAPFNSEGKLGLRFTVNKFSTFSLVTAEAIAPEPEAIRHTAYINGYPDGAFRPDAPVTRAEIAAIAARIAALPEAGAEQTYSDVTAAHWAYGAIAKAGRMGLMEGYGDGTFGADSTITRAELAAVIARLTGQSSAQGPGFTDIAGHWAEASIVSAQGAGIVTGYEGGEFRPDQPVTRAETVTMMNKALGRDALAEQAQLPWSDVSDNHWAVRDIAEASVDHTHE